MLSAIFKCKDVQHTISVYINYQKGLHQVPFFNNQGSMRSPSSSHPQKEGLVGSQVVNLTDQVFVFWNVNIFTIVKHDLSKCH